MDTPPSPDRSVASPSSPDSDAAGADGRRTDGGSERETDGGPGRAVSSWVPDRAHAAFVERFGIDLRALAAFRIALGLLVVGDLLFRAREIRAFYTDAGVLPREAHAELFPVLARASLHTLSGSTEGQALLFAVGGLFAVATAAGYRTRIATAGALASHASLYARNPYLLNGGDGLLVLALFLGVFLPLGARWSVDAALAGPRRATHGRPTDAGDASTAGGATTDSGATTASGRVSSLATATLLSQLVIVYAANALFKLRSDAWTSGRAVQYALELEQFSVLLGPSLTAYPELLAAINWAWFGMLWTAPLLVLATGRFRVAVVAAFAGAHLGMLATMRLGLFPIVVVALLLAYLPSAVWDRLERRLRARSIPDRIAGALRRRRQRVPPTSDRLYGPAAVRRLGRDVAPTVRRLGRTIAVVVLAAALVGSVLWPAAALGAAEGTSADRVVETDEYTWTLFAPNTPTHVVWFVAPARLESGEEVDAFRGGPVDWSEPDDAADTYPSALWHRYLTDVRWAGEEERRPLAAYLCREAGTTTGGEPTDVSVYALRRPIDAVGGGDVEHRELIRHDCAAEAGSGA